MVKMLRPTKSRFFNGDHVYELAIDELKHNLQCAALRTVCANPFDKVAVFAFRWDYDGLEVDGTGTSFKPWLPFTMFPTTSVLGGLQHLHDDSSHFGSFD